jgi:ESCRT-I complex subunit VPS28
MNESPDTPPPPYETAASSSFSINNGSYNNQQAQAYSSSRIKYSEIKLFENSKERSRCEDLSDLFAIIKTTDALEAAYSRDSLSSSEYSEACFKLISQFKTSESALVGSGTIVSADEFIREFDIDCPRAYERLIRVGVPATVAHATHDQRADIVIVAETVQEFITAMDVIKLGKIIELSLFIYLFVIYSK